MFLVDCHGDGLHPLHHLLQQLDLNVRMRSINGVYQVAG